MLIIPIIMVYLLSQDKGSLGISKFSLYKQKTEQARAEMYEQRPQGRGQPFFNVSWKGHPDLPEEVNNVQYLKEILEKTAQFNRDEYCPYGKGKKESCIKKSVNEVVDKIIDNVINPTEPPPTKAPTKPPSSPKKQKKLHDQLADSEGHETEGNERAGEDDESGGTEADVPEDEESEGDGTEAEGDADADGEETSEGGDDEATVAPEKEEEKEKEEKKEKVEEKEKEEEEEKEEDNQEEK